MSKKRFTEKLSFETEVAQAAALSAILLSKKQRQARGLDELRINTDGFKVIETGMMRLSRNG